MHNLIVSPLKEIANLRTLHWRVLLSFACSAHTFAVFWVVFDRFILRKWSHINIHNLEHLVSTILCGIDNSNPTESNLTLVYHRFVSTSRKLENEIPRGRETEKISAEKNKTWCFLFLLFFNKFPSGCALENHPGRFLYFGKLIFVSMQIGVIVCFSSARNVDSA